MPPATSIRTQYKIKLFGVSLGIKIFQGLVGASNHMEVQHCSDCTRPEMQSAWIQTTSSSFLLFDTLASYAWIKTRTLNDARESIAYIIAQHRSVQSVRLTKDANLH
ncbi:hypothetical protein GJ744_010190 [Endocarpon pusillum]|uniref:Uncharacterized protein n=1 Tax=Endocarpon pusillum TaxID=364733 RepID=A0A8H7AII9_9EURO|nr:hypothetical protein GJ744_010190 [Endocarpon pusillum]